MSDADLRQAGDTLARPAAFRRGEDLEDGFQIVEDRQNQPAPAPKILLQGAPLGGLEQFCEISVSLEKCCKGDAEYGVGRMGLAADRPGGPPSDSEPAAMPPDPDIRREIDPGLGAGGVTDRDDSIEEPEALDKPNALVFGLAVDIRPDRHMVGLGLEYDRRRCRVCSAPPQPHGARVARLGGHPLAPGGGQQQGVAVEPSSPALGLRQDETLGNEIARGEVELAQDHGIGAAARQHQYGAVVSTWDRYRPAPRPVLALLCPQRVEVEQDVPLRLLATVAVQTCRAP